MKRTARNVLGGPLATCSTNPITGFWRDGCCQTGDEDLGIHTICARVTAEFLSFSRRRGNDLSTPAPQHGFPGLKPGDQWCLCASLFLQAHGLYRCRERNRHPSQHRGFATQVEAIA